LFSYNVSSWAREVILTHEKEICQEEFNKMCEEIKNALITLRIEVTISNLISYLCSIYGFKILNNHNATYNVEALEETNVCTIKKDDFQQLLREYPEIGFKIMETLCGRLERLENAIESMGTKDVEARVNTVLLEFARKYGQNSQNGIVVELPLSREGIANYIGVSRETVSRKMSLLQDEGIIEMVGNKKIIIRNIDAL
jgi:CRP-like cAMP-binding protein